MHEHQEASHDPQGPESPPLPRLGLAVLALPDYQGQRLLPGLLFLPLFRLLGHWLEDPKAIIP